MVLLLVIQTLVVGIEVQIILLGGLGKQEQMEFQQMVILLLHQLVILLMLRMVLVLLNIMVMEQQVQEYHMV